MAGGIGSRFWPVSRTAHPKQFIDILGTGESLIQQTFDRFEKICGAENIYVVTNKEYKDITLEQLPKISESQVICEPARRNTAPCIAYANFRIAAKNPNANVVVTPADHLILKEDIFIDIIQSALDHTSKNDVLLTIGIEPTRPDTGYGYIKYSGNGKNTVNQVVQFTEKPNLETAKEFLESGDYSWNSGMFIWKLSSIQKAMQELLPEVFELFAGGKDVYLTEKEETFINKTYPSCPDISIDYGIMEKADNVEVINASFGWSDLGTWGSLYEHLNKDDSKNATIDGNVTLHKASGNIISFPKNKKAVIQGVDDLIMIDTPNAFLLCRKEDEQQIKSFVNEMRDKGENEYL